jgi:hypothetical protein
LYFTLTLKIVICSLIVIVIVIDRKMFIV